MAVIGRLGIGAWGRCAAAVAAALVSTFAMVPSGSAGVDAPRFGDAKVLAKVPPPGFPEGIAVRGNTAYVAGPATFGTTGGPPSMVWAFDTDSGALVASYPVTGEDTTTEHANSSVAFAGDGRLYVLNTQLGLYRLDLGSGVQEAYGQPFPKLPPCPLAETCSPTNAPPIPNDLAFDSAGNAYVTDSTQATIWRVPAGGDAPEPWEPWFHDLRLASEYIGINGIRFNPERTHLFLTVSTDLTGRSLVYTLRLPPFGESPDPDDLQLFHEYLPGELPDGVAFGRSGLLYVAIANPEFSGVSVLRVESDADGKLTGKEVRRLGNAALSPGEPYDSPANIAFDGKGSILLTNHAFVTGAVDPDEFNVLAVFVDDKGSPLEKPAIT